MGNEALMEDDPSTNPLSGVTSVGVFMDNWTSGGALIGGDPKVIGLVVVLL